MSGSLRRSAANRPDDLAVVDFDGFALSYGEADARADDLAATLGKLDLGLGATVLLDATKSLDTFVALHALLRAGLNVVPCELGGPLHLASLARDVHPAAVLTAPGASEDLATCRETPDWCGLVVAIGEEPAATPLGEPGLTYFTSGSTGQPKGIVHTLDRVERFAAVVCEFLGLGASDRYANVAPLSFDLSVLDVFCAATTGGAVLLIPRWALSFPPAVLHRAGAAGVTVWQSVPSAARTILLTDVGRATDDSGRQALAGSLRLAILAGEPIEGRLADALLHQWPGVDWRNVYGSTELNDLTIGAFDQRSSDGRVLAGRELPGCHLRLVNGNLYARSPWMLRGYLQGTAFEPLVTVDLDGNGDEGLGGYVATGDRAAIDDGCWQILGRVDSVAKIAGERVDIEGLESALRSFEQIDDVAVVPTMATRNQTRLMAHLVLAGDCGLETAMTAIRDILPPRYLAGTPVVHGSLPRTANGKIDRAALAGRERAT